MQHSPTQTGSMSVHGECAHEQLSVWVRMCVCECTRVCVRARVTCSHVQMCACQLAHGACLPHRRCDPIAGQGRRGRQSQVVEVRWRDLMVEGSRYISTSVEVSRYSTVKSDLPLMVAAISDLQRWTVEQGGTTQHQIPVIPMNIIVAYRLIDD